MHFQRLYDSLIEFTKTEKMNPIFDNASGEGSGVHSHVVGDANNDNTKDVDPLYSEVRDEETKRGKNVSRKESVKGKGKAKASTTSDNYKNDLAEIKEQLKTLMGLVPVVKEIKQAYDNFNEVADNGSESGCRPSNNNTNRAPHDPSGLEDSVTARYRCAGVEDDTDKDDNELSYFESLVGEQEKTGANIANNIATGITNVLTNGMNKDVVKGLTEKYKIPENCSRMSVVKCNEEIFKQANNACRLKDYSLQNIQLSLVKGLTAVSSALDSLVGKIEKNELEKISDGVALLANASHDLDVFRRQEFKGDIKQDYNALCTASYPVEGKLFGNNIGDRLKDINESMKVSRNARKFRPYYNKRFPFLGKSQNWTQRDGSSYSSRQQTKQNRQNQTWNQNRSKARFNQRK